MNTHSANQCPQCGQAIAPGLQGLCPNCLALVGFGGNPAGDQTVVVTPGQPPGPTPQVPLSASFNYFGDYELLEEIARGGMGVVWRARQKSLNRVVAVKMILGGQLATEADVKRFHTEAEAAANLKHPNIVAIHEIGEHAGRHYFSMDLIEGKNLAQVIGNEPLPPQKAATLLKTLAEAVHYAHQRGTLHRDLKPQNVLLDTEERPHITDFGLAKQMTGQSDLTQSGTVMGSPSYMPPEQAAGKLAKIGPASDVYSLGAILYQMLTAKAPFAGATPVDTLRQVIEKEPVPPSKLNARTPSDLETICLKCLEKKPERRYATARALAEELGRFLNHEPILARRANPIRKAWLWLTRHPWAITGLFSFVVLGLAALAYGLSEEAVLLRWKLANPKGTPPYGPVGYVTVVALGLLFVFQSAPLITFLERKARGNLKRPDFWCYGVIGLMLVAAGFWTVSTGLKLEIWMNRFGSSVWLWGIAAFSNVWFGSLLIWKTVQYFREPDAPNFNVARRSTLPRLARSARLNGIVLLEFAVIIASTVALSRPPAGAVGLHYGTADIVAWSIVFSIWGLSWTLLILSLAHLARSTGVNRTLFLPLLALSLALSFGGLSLPEAPKLPSLIALVAGLVSGWGVLRWGCLEGGETPRLSAPWVRIIRLVSVRNWARAVLTAIAVLALFLFVDRARGKWKLAAVRADMAKRGQAMEFKQLLTAPPPNFQEFTNRFNIAVKSLVGEGKLYGSGNRVEVAPGKAARGSQATRPASWDYRDYRGLEKLILTNGMAREIGNPTNAWAIMEKWQATNEAAFAELRVLLHDPPSVWSFDYLKDLQEDKYPIFVPLRFAAWSLNDIAMLHLHQGDLRAAKEDLVALSGLVRMNSKDPTLVGQMFRVAIAGIGTSALWDALQADGWTEPQLERIQRAWQIEPLVPRVATALHTERLKRVETYEAFRRENYSDWAEKQRKMLAGWGRVLKEPLFIVEIWRRHIFHPLWKFAWADLEESLYLKGSDILTASMKEAIGTRNFKDWRFNPQSESWRSPFASWRFYLVLPGDQMMVFAVDNSIPDSTWPFAKFTLPDFTKAIETALKNENLREMAVIAIALKRYHLRQGHYPNQLTELVPSLLPEVPVDWMSGNSLRYRVNTDGTYLLYSVGQDGRDDNGDPTKDEVWPTVVPWEK